MTKDRKCGNCLFLVDDEGEPFYCAILDLYTVREKDDPGCEDWVDCNIVERNQKRIIEKSVEINEKLKQKLLLENERLLKIKKSLPPLREIRNPIFCGCPILQDTERCTARNAAFATVGK